MNILSGFSIHKSINVIYHINKAKDTITRLSQSIQKNILKKSNTHSRLKTLNAVGIIKTYLNIIKSTLSSGP